MRLLCSDNPREIQNDQNEQEQTKSFDVVQDANEISQDSDGADYLHPR